MSITEAVAERMKSLPPDKQQEVLDFVEFLQQKAGAPPRRPLKSPYGLWSDLGVNITEEDIARARREVWGNFPPDGER
jgi:hypothetical protein